MESNENKKNDNADIENKRVYLQLLQEPIGRMSSTSAIFKCFSAAILAGLASASFTEISVWALLLGLLPILSFLCLDVYYLSLERKLRYLYRMVVENKKEIDFSINTRLDKKENKVAKSTPLNCLKSPSILLFYVPVLACASILFILKLRNII